MSKRQVVMDALAFRPPAYVPWSIALTLDAADGLRRHLGAADLAEFLDDHFAHCGEGVFSATPVDATHVRDPYGVVWDRSVDKDIGTPSDWPLKSHADLAGYRWPEVDAAMYAGARACVAANPGRYVMYDMGFLLFERAWCLRGMENLLVDMVEAPAFVEALLDAITEHNLVQVRAALATGVDAIGFGDDYGMQTGLMMGAANWRRFFKPRLARLFAPVRAAGKHVRLHSCGAVHEVFDDLVQIGLNLFNPFQPEVMDVFDLLPRYRVPGRGRLAFHGGMSVQKILPFGTVAEVRDATHRLLDAGAAGGYVFAPSHGVPRDTPPENLVAMVEVLKAQPGYRRQEQNK